MKQKLRYIAVFLFAFSLVISATSVAAAKTGQLELCPAGDPGTCPIGQCVGSDGKCVLANPAPGQLADYNSFEVLLVQIIRVFLLFAGAIAVVFLVVGGFQYVASRGNEEAAEKAKKTITNAIIGLIIIVMAYAIVTIVNNLLTKPAANQGKTTGLFILAKDML